MSIHKDVIAAADSATIREYLTGHGNPKVREAAKHMALIAEMHGRGDYALARELQIVEDVLYMLPMVEIDKLIALYRKGKTMLQAIAAVVFSFGVICGIILIAIGLHGQPQPPRWESRPKRKHRVGIHWHL